MLRKILLFSLAIFSMVEIATAKVLIITHAYNRPDFIEIQAKTFKKFLKDDYEFVVFNDATKQENIDGINEVCKTWKVKCIRVPQEIHERLHPDALWNNPFLVNSKRHGECIQYSLETIGYKHNDVVALFDSDLFLIRPLSIKKLMVNYEIASLTRTDNDGVLSFLWPGLSFIQMNRLPNKETLDYSCGVINGHCVDTGGNSYYYLINNPGIRLKSLGVFPFLVDYIAYDSVPDVLRKIHYRNLGFNLKEIKLLMQKPHDPAGQPIDHICVGMPLEFAYHNHFMHYRGGSFGDLPRKSQLVHEFINDIVK